MRFLILAIAALPLRACATVIRGTTEQVAFQSDPAGAEVTTSTGLSCPATPCFIEVPRKDAFIATFSKPERPEPWRTVEALSLRADDDVAGLAEA
jgi:hypothetical protein